MATLSLKPTNRYAPGDWFSSNEFISTNAERQRVATHQIRQEARELVNGMRVVFFPFISIEDKK